jgi:predicted transposase YbfD/YdcC
MAAHKTACQKIDKAYLASVENSTGSISVQPKTKWVSATGEHQELWSKTRHKALTRLRKKKSARS